MKNKYIKVLAFIIIVLINSSQLLGQATSGNNGNVPAGAGEYIGWTNGTNATLVIKNEDDQPINFYTNAGNGTLNNLRMLIDSINGFIGMGRNFTAPQSILHINGTNNSTGEVFRTDGPTGNDQFWRMYRAGGLYGTLYNLAGARHSFNATLQKIFL